MKRLGLMLWLVCAGSLQAQRGDQEAWLELVRTDIKAEKVAILAAAMQLNTLEAKVFWPIQREYQGELGKLGDVRVRTIRDYLAHVETMTDKYAERLAKASLDYEKKRLKLKEKYYKKMAKAISPSTAVRFFQVESQLQAMIDVALAMEMPVMPRSVIEKVKGTQ